MSDDLETTLGRIGAALGPARFAYVFGSFLEDRLGGESDLDVAVEWGRPLTAGERLELTGRLSVVVGREVDLVDLASADPVIRMQVLRYGRLVVDNDRSARHRFEVRALGEYADLKLDRAPVEAAMMGDRGARR